jgi:ankyrin repeat protein
LGKLLENGFVSAQSVEGKTPYLVLAAKEGHLAVVKLLVGYGAPVNVPDEDGGSALAWSAANGHVGVARFLLKKEAEVNKKK